MGSNPRSACRFPRLRAAEWCRGALTRFYSGRRPERGPPLACIASDGITTVAMKTNHRQPVVAAAILWAMSLVVSSWAAEGDPGKPTPQQEFARVLMADYRGANPESTVASRKEALAAVIDATSVVVEVLSWPDRFSVGVPGLESSRFDDGDRGFVWQMSAEQVRVLVLERLKKKDRLTVNLPQPWRRWTVKRSRCGPVDSDSHRSVSSSAGSPAGDSNQPIKTTQPAGNQRAVLGTRGSLTLSDCIRRRRRRRRDRRRIRRRRRRRCGALWHGLQQDER